MFFGRNDLSKAIERDDLTQVRNLLAQDAGWAAKRGARKQLSLALEKASDEVVLTLAANGWNLLEKNGSNHNALSEAAHHARHAIISAWVKDFPLLWSREDCAKLLNIAIRNKDMPTLRYLIDNNISDPDALPGYWDKPLNIAQAQQNGEAVQILRAALAGNTAPVRAVEVATPAVNNDVSATTVWHVVDAATIIRVREQAAAGYRLTDIFNFATGTIICVQRNLETDQETAVTLDLNAASAAPLAQEARAQLEQAGGKPSVAPPSAAIVKKPAGGA